MEIFWDFSGFSDFLTIFEFFLDFGGFIWIFLDFFGFFWIFWIFFLIFFWVFGFFDFLDFWIFRFFFLTFLWFIFYFFGFFGIPFKVTNVTTKSYQGYFWTPKIAKNGPKRHNNLIFCPASAEALRRELEVGPRSGPYLLVFLTLVMIIRFLVFVM